MLVKLYGEAPDSAKGRYSPAECIGARKERIEGSPDPAHVNTYYAQNLPMRMAMRRFTRLTNAFSKKWENHVDMVALYTVWYNFVKQHKSLGDVTPATAAKVPDRLLVDRGYRDAGRECRGSGRCGEALGDFASPQSN
jgi:hypothetical protein